MALPTEYGRGWEELTRLYQSFAPDVVVHFGLSGEIEAIHLECVGRNAVDTAKPDAAGHAPPSPRLVPDGPDMLRATLPVDAIREALVGAGFPAALSDDAGDYVCNATLYRSLRVATPARRVGFVHVPPEGTGVYTANRLAQAAILILKAAVAGSSAPLKQ